MGQIRELAAMRVTRVLAEELLEKHEFSVEELSDRLGMSEAFIDQEVLSCRLKAAHAGDEIVTLRRPEVLAWISRIETEAQNPGYELLLVTDMYSNESASGEG